MKRIVAFFITIFIVSAIIYLNVNSEVNKDNVSLEKHSSISNYLSKKFKSGIFIQDIGDLIIIEQKPNDATVIINKNDLDDIIAFLNNTNSSEE